MSRKILLSMCLILLLGLSSMSSAALVGRWSFDDQTANDSSGNGRNGTLVGNAAIVSDGARGSVLSLDGNGDYANITNYKGILGTGSRTTCAWIKTTGESETILSWGNNAAGQKWDLLIDPTTKYVRQGVNIGYRIGTINVGDGKWHHIATVVANDGSPNANEIKIYVDGVEQSYTTTAQAINTGSNFDVRIGSFNSAAYFNGQIDDVRIYDTALTVTDVLNIYMEEVEDAGLVGCWNFDDSTGNDSSGYRHDGILFGNAAIVADGQRGNVIELDGSGDYVDLGNGSWTNPGNSMSMAAWVKVDVFDAAYQAVLAKGLDSYRLSRNSSGNVIQVYMNYTSSSYKTATSGVNVNDAAWHHLAVTYDGTNMKLYVDGIVDATNTLSTLYTTTDPLMIGRNSGNTGRDWQGWIDDVRLYKRALSDAEIAVFAEVRYTISGSVGTVDGVTMNGLPGNPVTSGGGAYSATVNYGWTGTATPSKAGYTFSPTNKTYSNVTANQTAQNYTSTLLTYTISGTVGTVDGVTMGGLPGSPVTSGGGNYTATVVYGWTGTATPSKAGYTFSPTNKTYSNVTANQSAQNYTPTLLTYTISGTVGTLDGVTMNGLPGTPVTSGGGAYSATVNYGWTGTATPSKAGYAFSPTNKTYSNVTANQTAQNYTPTLLTYTISGTVGTVDGVTMGGLPGSPVTSGGGAYSATVNYGWTGTATPSKTGYTFSPVNKTYINVTANQSAQNYTPTLLTYTITGTISDVETMHEMDGVTMSGMPGSPVTDVNGFYTATVGYGWSGTAIPTRAGFTFAPANKTYSNVTAGQSGQDYSATVITYTLSGYVGTLEGVLFENLPCSPATDENGFYTCQVEYGWSGTAIPDKEGYVFNPTSKTYSNVTSDQSNQNYTPTSVNAENPSPENGTVDVLANQTLSWTSAAVAKPVGGQNVYFGTSLDAVTSRDESVFIGNQSGTTYNPGTLTGLTTYYWAIDTINEAYEDSPWAGKVWSFTTINTELVGYWRINEGSGTTATDISGYGHNGTITGAAWVSDGVMGNVLEFDGVDYITIPSAAFSSISSQVTIALWQYGDAALQPQNNSIFEGTKSGTSRVLNAHIPWGTGIIYFDAGYTTAYDRINKAADSASQYEGQWNHWAFTKDTSTGLMKIYFNGELWHSGTGMTRSMSGITAFKIGSLADGTSNYDGMICEFRLYNVALSDEQIRALVGQNIAKDPLPAHKAYNVNPYPTLSWTPTPLAADTDGHDLYLGTDAALVANRDASVHVGLLDTNSYLPELRLSTTYYWVVDEVNDSEPGSPWAGEVWQFTVRSTTEGYYKDLFIDGGAGLTGYKASDIPAVGQIGYTNEHVTSNNVTVTRKIMVKANAGDWIDDNGVLLYPDNEPRFRMIYVNGGSSGEHKTNLEPEGTGIMQNFVHNGGCYTASCAGAWLSGEKSFRWMLAPLALSTTSTGSTLTDGVFPDGVTSYRGRILPLSPLVAYNPELFGDFKVHGIRQNGGCRCNVGTTGWVEGKSEALLLFDMTWTLYTADPNAVPLDLTIYGSDTQKATHHQCMVWGEKESPEHGKLAPCGSHPEHQQTYGEETPLQAAIYQYAFSFNGRATVKAALTDGVARQMNDNATAGHEKIGDKQYHHFTIEVPQGATQLQIVLDGNLYDMNLYAKNGDFAFMGEQNTVAAANSTAIDETLTINNPTAGTWYIGVKCNKAVAASVNGATYSYTSRFELLNGLAYTITATVQE